MKNALPRISPCFQKPLGWLQGPDHPLQLVMMHIVLPSSLLMNPNVATCQQLQAHPGHPALGAPGLSHPRWTSSAGPLSPIMRSQLESKLSEPRTSVNQLLMFQNDFRVFACQETIRTQYQGQFRKLRSWHLVLSPHGKQMGKQWKQCQTIFLGSKITVDGDCSHEFKRHSLEGKL